MKHIDRWLAMIAIALLTAMNARRDQTAFQDF
jgi:hypothetical protein